MALMLVIANLAFFMLARRADEGDAPGATRPAPPDVPRTLRLLEDVPVADVPVADVPVAEMPVAEMPAVGPRSARSPGRHCERIGPFDSRPAAKAAAERAGTMALASVVRVPRGVEGAPEYQVHLPPRSSLERARLRVRELEALNVDSFVVQDSGFEGAISVGLFTSRERAEARRDAISELGYEVHIRRLERTEIRVRGPEAAIQPLFLALTADHPGLERGEVDCGTAAIARTHGQTEQ